MNEFSRNLAKLEPITNADRIRNMTNGELAEFLLDVSNGCTKITACDEKCDECNNGIKTCLLFCERWLEKKVEE